MSNVKSKKPLFVDVLSNKQKVQLNIRVVIWLFALSIFWYWWIKYTGYHSWAIFVINSFILAYVTVAPAYFYFFITRMRRVNPALDVPKKRVALIVTRVPSAEPFKMVKKTLKAMLSQDLPYKYDVWLADEDPSNAVYAWCKKNDVRVSTRKGNELYNSPTWPKRRRSKEGNLAYFYDHYGYDNYDVVLQFDADHVPSPSYASSMIKPFSAKNIGYVSAPSICSKNQSKSWAVRGRLFGEATMHGPLQLGFNDGYMPICFGSHYAVRTKALKQIGGIGPELAEDLSTTIAMNAAGWDGAFAIDAEAVGDGPTTFYDCMKQELQWARSVFNLLLTYAPKLFWKLSWRKKIQAVYCLVWYLLMASSSMLGYLLPVASIVLATALVKVNYIAFIYFSAVTAFSAIEISAWLKKQGLFRPVDAPVASWEQLLFSLGRWPWAAWGLVLSVIDSFRSTPFSFRVTPKDDSSTPKLHTRHLAAYVMVFFALVLPMLFKHNDRNVGGYYYVALFGGLWYMGFVVAVMLLHRKENNSKIPVRQFALVQVMMVVFLVSVHNTLPEMESAFNHMIKGVVNVVN